MALVDPSPTELEGFTSIETILAWAGFIDDPVRASFLHLLGLDLSHHVRLFGSLSEPEIEDAIKTWKLEHDAVPTPVQRRMAALAGRAARIKVGTQKTLAAIEAEAQQARASSDAAAQLALADLSASRATQNTATVPAPQGAIPALPETPQDSTPAAGKQCKLQSIVQALNTLGLLKEVEVYIFVGVVIGLSIVALIVDYLRCKHRWQAGLLAEFPNMIPATFLVAFVLILALMCTGAFTTDQVILWSVSIVMGSLCLASLASQLLGRPWVRGMAREHMTPEQIQETTTSIGAAIHESIMSAITTLWTCTFGLMALCRIGAGIWEVYGGGGWTARTTGSVFLTVVAVHAFTKVQPKVIERARQRARATFSTGDNADTSLQAMDLPLVVEHSGEQLGMSP